MEHRCVGYGGQKEGEGRLRRRRRQEWGEGSIQRTFFGFDSNDIKQSDPWSNMPLNFLSKIICDNLKNSDFVSEGNMRARAAALRLD